MHQKGTAFPRILISALRGGSGKTLLSIGIIAAWRAMGKSIAPFKKGPDYIDTGWLALAAGQPCYNLDTFLVPKETVRASFLAHARPHDISVIEGNRGLFDGIDIEGYTSTAELAKLIDTPVILSINCTKTTRTMAAVVSGCNSFDPDVQLSGVILNHVAGSRHESILRKTIEHHCGIPVLGAVPNLKSQYFPERHMGLVPTPEHSWAKASVGAAARVAEAYLDLDALLKTAMHASTILNEDREQRPEVGGKSEAKTEGSAVIGAPLAPRIGVIKDSAFQFYYPENIEVLASEGAETVFVSPLKDTSLPELDALYIGGGFPETHARALADNTRFRDDIKSLAEDGFPIYAECGGLMYLGEELIINGKAYPMTGVLPISYDFSKKPQGHGYTIIVVENNNPYYDIGLEIRGHEFHYSRVARWGGRDEDLIFRMIRGKGIYNKFDGFCYKNVLATYSHIHVLGTPAWAKAMIRNALVYRKKKTGQTL